VKRNVGNHCNNPDEHNLIEIFQCTDTNSTDDKPNSSRSIHRDRSVRKMGWTAGVRFPASKGRDSFLCHNVLPGNLSAGAERPNCEVDHFSVTRLVSPHQNANPSKCDKIKIFGKNSKKSRLRSRIN
jgi:hypothetical protein